MPPISTPPTRNIPALLAVAAFFALVAALAYTLLRGPGTLDPMIGQPAPPLNAPILAGAIPDGAHVVNFWATWCTPCLVEHPVLMEMAADGVPIVGVAYRDDEAKMARYLGEKGNPYVALVFDAAGNSLPAWGVRGVPETFVVGPDGTVIARFVGAIEEPIY